MFRMDNDNLTAVLRAMQDRPTLQRDFQEIASAMKGMLHEKYLRRLQTALLDHAAQTQQNPPKEARLLEACKPFLPAERHEAIDKARHFFQTWDACQHIHSRIKTAAQTAATQAKPNAQPFVRAAEAASDPSLHRDGVYDIDSQCARAHGIDGYTARHKENTSTLLFLLFLIVSGQSL